MLSKNNDVTKLFIIYLEFIHDKDVLEKNYVFTDFIKNIDVIKNVMTNLCFFYGKEYVYQISCKNKHFQELLLCPPPIRGSPQTVHH